MKYLEYNLQMTILDTKACENYSAASGQAGPKTEQERREFLGP